uniref:Uncharacterized protein n=1 Tax=Arundo donax TaxID=35708 RepID=A0A0A9H4D3_ARUDO
MLIISVAIDIDNQEEEVPMCDNTAF